MADGNPLSVRRATASDLDAVSGVWHESAVTMDGAPDVPSREALRSRIDSELSSGWELHVAVVGPRIVGFLALKPGEASLDQIFVAPDQQGQGVGRALLAAAKAVLPDGFTLRMAASNGEARRFYERQGLKRLGDGVHPRTKVPVIFYGWESGDA